MMKKPENKLLLLLSIIECVFDEYVCMYEPKNTFTHLKTSL